MTRSESDMGLAKDVKNMKLPISAPKRDELELQKKWGTVAVMETGKDAWRAVERKGRVNKEYNITLLNGKYECSCWKAVVNAFKCHHIVALEGGPPNEDDADKKARGAVKRAGKRAGPRETSTFGILCSTRPCNYKHLPANIRPSMLSVKKRHRPKKVTDKYELEMETLGTRLIGESSFIAESSTSAGTLEVEQTKKRMKTTPKVVQGDQTFAAKSPSIISQIDAVIDRMESNYLWRDAVQKLDVESESDDEFHIADAITSVNLTHDEVHDPEKDFAVIPWNSYGNMTCGLDSWLNALYITLCERPHLWDRFEEAPVDSVSYTIFGVMKKIRDRKWEPKGTDWLSEAELELLVTDIDFEMKNLQGDIQTNFWKSALHSVFQTVRTVAVRCFRCKHKHMRTYHHEIVDRERRSMKRPNIHDFLWSTGDHVSECGQEKRRTRSNPTPTGSQSTDVEVVDMVCGGDITVQSVEWKRMGEFIFVVTDAKESTWDKLHGQGKVVVEIGEQKYVLTTVFKKSPGHWNSLNYIENGRDGCGWYEVDGMKEDTVRYRGKTIEVNKEDEGFIPLRFLFVRDV